MELTHRFTVPIPVDETWAHFNDIASVAQCFPGATVGSVEEDTFSGTVKVKLGPIALVYAGSGSFVEKDDAAHRFVVDAKGKDKRGNGTAGARVTLSMAEAGGATDVEVLTDLSVTGKPAQFGRGVMQDVSDKLLGQFVDCLEQRLGAEQPAGAAAEPGGAAGEPGGAAEEPAGAAGEPAGEPAAAAASPAASPAAAVDQDAEPASAPTGAAAAASPAADQDAGPGSEPPAGVLPDVSAVAEPESPPKRQGVPQPAPTPRHAGPPQEDALDLGATVLPVLARTYWKQGLGALAVLLVVLLWWRRRG